MNQTPHNPNAKDKPARRPRFKRTPFASCYLKDLDIQLLKYAYVYRLLDTGHFTALCDNHPLTIKRRLQNLFHNGYLDRPVSQLHAWTSGSRQFVYALGARGAKALQEKGVPISEGVDWYEKNKHIKNDYIQHRLGITNFRVMLDLAVRAHNPHLTLEPVAHTNSLWWEWQGGPKAQHKRPTVSFSHRSANMTAGICPDGLFSIGQGEKSYPCFVEYDTGSMPVYRSNPNLTSIARKFLIYWNLWDQEVQHKKRLLHTSPLKDFFDVETFRVLFITTTPERIASMIKSCQDLFKTGRKLFWFTTFDQMTLDNPQDIFKPIWYTGSTQLYNSRVVSPQQTLPQAFGSEHLPQPLIPID